MKRTILMSVLLVALVAFPLCGQSVTAGSAPALCGTMVRVPVTVANVSSLVALEFRLEYDASRLTVMSVVTGDLTTGFYVASNLQPGWAKIAMASGKAVAGGGTVAVIAFKVAADASGEVPLVLSQVLVNDTAIKPAGGIVTIECGERARADPAP